MNSRLLMVSKSIVLALLLVASFATHIHAASLASTFSCVPQVPTTKDSISFSLNSMNYDCCTQIYNAKVQVLDSSIYLSYAYDNSPLAGVCACLVAGKIIPFKSGPLMAGRYVIYEAQSLYCAPGTVCALLAIMPQRIGEITVVPGVGTLVDNAKSLPQKFSFATRAGTITFCFTKANAHNAFLAIYNVQGSTVKKISMRDEGTGHFEARWQTGVSNATMVLPGAYCVRIVVDGRIAAQEKILVVRQHL